MLQQNAATFRKVKYMTELVSNVNYISAFRVNTGGNASSYLTRIEEAITSNAGQLQAHQLNAGQPAQAYGSSSQNQGNRRQLWNLTPQGARGQVQVELDRDNNEISVSGNFSDILMLNRAIVATTGEKDGITIQA
jgi:hypothetical protein